jgi:hypothetical protein
MIVKLAKKSFRLSASGSRSMVRYIECVDHENHAGKSIEVGFLGSVKNDAEFDRCCDQILQNHGEGRPRKHAAFSLIFSGAKGDGKLGQKEFQNFVSGIFTETKSAGAKWARHYDPIEHREDIHLLVLNDSRNYHKALSYETRRVGLWKLCTAVSDRLIADLNKARTAIKAAPLKTVREARREKRKASGFIDIPAVIGQAIGKDFSMEKLEDFLKLKQAAGDWEITRFSNEPPYFSLLLPFRKKASRYDVPLLKKLIEDRGRTYEQRSRRANIQRWHPTAEGSHFRDARKAPEV